MKVFKTVVASILILGAVALMFFGYPSPMVVEYAGSNPWGLTALQALEDFALDNEELYELRMDTLNGWEKGTIDHWRTLQEVDFKAPWEENDDEYYSNISILGTTIKVYSPDATNQGEYWEADKYFEFDIPTSFENISWDEMDEYEQEYNKELAVALYYYANSKYVNSPTAGYYSVCFTDNVAVGLHNRVNLDILEIRNRGEFYKQDYRLDGGIDLFESMAFMEDELNKALELKCAERRYCNMEMTKTLYDKSNNAKLQENIPFTNWSVKGKDATDLNVYNPQPFSEQSKPIDSSSIQDKNGNNTTTKYTPRGFQKCAHVIEFGLDGNNDTIKSAVITKNEWGGLSVDIELITRSDTSEFGYINRAKRATQYTIQGIRDGSGDQQADYVMLNIKFDLWANGMYRTYYQAEQWAGKAAKTFDVSSTFIYNDVFFYNEEDCDIQKYIENWNDAKEFSNAYNG